MAASTGSAAYDAVAYLSYPHPVSHPEPLAVGAHLHRLEPADPATCRFLDLGCGDGGNLLAVAAAYPRATCAGLDASRPAIERGQAVAAAAGLDVDLRVADLLDLPGDLGEFDYVVAQGVLSWVPPPVRDALLAAIGRLLAPGGVACLSYHALPGFHLRAVGRDIARRRLGDDGDLETRVSRGRAALALVSELHGTGDVYGHLLAREKARYAERDDWLLYHDELSGECTPFAVCDLAELSAAHGLAYLGEVVGEDMWQWRLESGAARKLRAVAGPASVARQQLADDVAGAAFKATLLIRAESEAAAEQDPARALDLYASLAADGTPPPEPQVIPAERVWGELAAAAPASVPVRELAARAGLDEIVAAKAVLRLVAFDRAALRLGPPPWTLQPGERPEVSPLARAQATIGDAVSSLSHRSVVLQDLVSRELVPAIDGTRDRAQLAAALASAARRASMPEDRVAKIVGNLEEHLGELARLGLLRA
jgi:SAM-dependent methyltransferase